MMVTIADIGEAAAWPLAMAGGVSTIVGFNLNRAVMNDLRRRYQIDATRRTYLASRARGRYAGLATAP